MRTPNLQLRSLHQQDVTGLPVKKIINVRAYIAAPKTNATPSPKVALFAFNVHQMEAAQTA